MTNNIFFSVIVCVFNAAKYFSRGISCLAGQHFQAFEVILVDDGSTDETPLLCDLTAEGDSRFKVVHQQNAGPGPARNKGMEQAVGRYLCFFDIDDIVRCDWLEILYKRIVENEPQLLIYGYREIREKNKTITEVAFDELYFQTNEELRAGYLPHLSGLRCNNGFVWNKVYERDSVLSNDLRFSCCKIQQDELFNLAVYKKTDRVRVVAEVLYDYYIYEKGNIRSTFIPDRTDIFCKIRESFLDLYQCWQLDDDRFLRYVHERFIKSLLFNCNRNLSGRARLDYFHSLVKMDAVQASVRFIARMDPRSPGHDLLFDCYCSAIRKQAYYTMLALQIISDSIAGLKNRIRPVVHRIKGYDWSYQEPKV